jgi:peroxiredoxin
MKTKTLFSAIGAAALCFSASCTWESTIEIPISLQAGYGPFPLGLAGVTPDSEDESNPWRKTYLKVTGIPEEWTDTQKGDIEINIYQTVYQNYLQGNISQERYEELQRSWSWIPDTLKLSKKPLKSKIAFAFGKDAAGTTKMVVDANNNLDFSDDTIFTPVELDLEDTTLNRDSLALKSAISVAYERLSGNQIIQEKALLFIAYGRLYDMWMYNFAQHATATFKGKELAIYSSHSTDLLYDNTDVILMDDSLKSGKKATMDELISENEYLAFDNELYKYKGVNMDRGVMMLEKVALPKNQVYSTQTGFKAIPFEGRDFTSNDSITLHSYKEKYLLIDFWAVWCGPCIQELPSLKAMYDTLDTSKVEIIGIVGSSRADALEKMIAEHGITWPQILSDELNPITKKYGVNGYPTTFLIDPNGVIIAKNLRGKTLEDKISELQKSNK